MKKPGVLSAKEVFEVLKRHYLSKGVRMTVEELILLAGDRTPPETLIRGRNYFDRYLTSAAGKSGGMIEPLEGYERLTDEERKVFVRGHQKHLSSLPEEKRHCYTLADVVAVTSNKQENGVEARFISGERFTYNSKGAVK